MYGATEDEIAAPALRVVPRQATNDSIDTTVETLGEEVDDQHHPFREFVPIAVSFCGVVLFLRLGTIVGSLGLFYTWLVISITFVVTAFTVGSLAALATGHASARKETHLFPSIRHTVGLKTSRFIAGLCNLSFATATAYYNLAFTEVCMDFLGVHPAKYSLPWNGSWVAALVASGVNLVLALGYWRGLSLSKRTVWVAFGVITLTLGCGILFLLLPGDPLATGVSMTHLRDNRHAQRPSTTIGTVGKFFPAFTGVLAGVNLAQTIDDAPKTHVVAGVGPVRLVPSIYRGLVFALAVYFAMSLLLASCVSPEFLLRDPLVLQIVPDAMLGVPVIHMGTAVMTLFASFSNIMAGVASLVYIRTSKNSVKAGDAVPSPHIDAPAVIWTWALSQMAVLSGSVDVILPFVSTAFLLVFAVVNFTCFYVSISSPSFKSSFVLSSPWTAFAGFVLSLGMLFVQHPAAIGIVVFTSLCIAVLHYPSLFAHLVGAARDLKSNRSETRRVNEKAPLEIRTSAPVALQVIAEDTANELQLHPSGKSRVNRDAIQLAALHVRDAIHGRFQGGVYDLKAPEALKILRWLHVVKRGRIGVMAVLFGLSFFEKPSWCFYEPSCGDPTQVKTWNLPVLSQPVSTVIELSALSLLTMELVAKHRYLGSQHFFLNKWRIVQMFCLTASVVSAVLTPFLLDDIPADSDDYTPPPFSQLLRPVLLLTVSERLRSGFLSLARVAGRVVDGLLAVVVLIVLYTIGGMMIFEGTLEGATYFANFGQGSLNLMIALTTANFPDVMMPGYDQTRISSLFFISFLTIGLLLMMHLVFASIYQNYRIEVSQRALEFARQRQKALKAAFQILYDSESHAGDLPEEKKVTSKAFEALVSELLRPVFSYFLDDASSSRVPSVQVGTHVRDMNFDQFVLNVKAFVARERLKPTIHERIGQQNDVESEANWVRQRVRSRWFEHSVDGLILVNLVVILFQVQARIDGDTVTREKLELYMPIFSCIYLVEMFLKVYTFTLSGYFARRKNIYDCFVTLVIFIAEISIRVNYSDSTDLQANRIVLFLRFLRCLRLLVALQSFSVMFNVVVRLLPAFTTLYGMMGIVMMEYAAIGMLLFGGKLAEGDPRLAETAYGKANYYSNNFNDFPSALTTLFELLIVNNWFVTMDGTVAVTSAWSRLYFISFYVIGVVMVLNLAIAFIVEAFFDQMNDTKAPTAPTPIKMNGAEDNQHAVKMLPRADSVYIGSFF
ncbi:hypothetical protein Poli38472_009628 [Pythium oligandrum]|uniref:Ion transport domain-containing protein n=1 Tax=Pythium oligandrum TaxID=41045 RepID=A0A8K1CG51_PYTOL|nr:hypothetical protein Poli38472_009628 [Pythium oligandrum]|eukprot:TMW62135.1 hypothetical protein Poli38472_009628 [Pythium oligandrum]